MLTGRLSAMVNPAATALCALFDKTGLLTEVLAMEDLDKCERPTLGFLYLMAAELSVCKAFTLDPQQQGGRPPFIDAIWTWLQTRPETRMDLIFLLMPHEAVVKLVPEEKRVLYASMWTARMQQFSLLLKQQWMLGVKDASTNQMIEPRRGSGVNSVLWNTLAGAWSNAVQCLRTLLGDQTPVFKCLKLTAGDQASWAHSDRPEGEAMDPNVAVVCELAAKGIHPWTCLDEPGRHAEVREHLTTVCEKLGAACRKVAWGTAGPHLLGSCLFRHG